MNRKRLFLFIYLILFVFMNNVNAAELNENVIISNSCSKNLFKPANWEVVGFKSGGLSNFTLVNRSDISTSYDNANNYVSEVLIPVSDGNTYCFSQEEDLYTGAIKYRFLDKDYNDLGVSANIYPRYIAGYNQCYTISNSSVSYLLLYIITSSSDILETIKSTNLQIELNEVTDYVAYEECVVEEPAPEPEPEVEPEGMQIVTNFYSVYLDRLVSFVSIASTNYVFLSFLAVIVIFIVVELFFKMFRR